MNLNKEKLQHFFLSQKLKVPLLPAKSVLWIKLSGKKKSLEENIGMSQRVNP